MRAHDARLRLQRGFTLVELLTTVTVAAILLGVGVPAFQQLIAAQRMRSASYDLVSDLVLARSEALKRGMQVRMAPVTGGWGAGWVVQPVGGSEPLASHDTLGRVQVLGAPASITFDLQGRVTGATTTVRIGLSDGSTRQRCISLDPSGRPRAVSTECPS